MTHPNLKKEPWKTAFDTGQLVYGMEQGSAPNALVGHTSELSFRRKGYCLGVALQLLYLVRNNANFDHDRSTSWIKNMSGVVFTLQKRQYDLLDEDKSIEETIVQLSREHKTPLRHVKASAGYVSHYHMAEYASRSSNGSLLILDMHAGMHAFGYFQKPAQKTGQVNFFDPNYGHFRFNDKLKLQQFLDKTGFLDKYYRSKGILRLDIYST